MFGFNLNLHLNNNTIIFKLCATYGILVSVCLFASLGLLVVMDTNVCTAWATCPTSCTAAALLHEVSRVRRVTGKPVAVPPYVLAAHWGDELGYSVLSTLSTRYRIVPGELLEFLQTTVALGRCIHTFLHPNTLFAQPATATWVYTTLAKEPLSYSLVDRLCYLCSSCDSNAYGHHISPLVVSGLVGGAAGFVADDVIRGLCRLGCRYVPVSDVPVNALGQLVYRETTCTAALTLVGRLAFSQRASIAYALAWAARCGFARAVQYMQSLSTVEEYAPRIASACQMYLYAAYIDRLGLVTLWHMVPHMVAHAKEARLGLVRLAASSGSRAVSLGVFTALIGSTSGGVVPHCPHVLEPSTAHETVHFVHATGALPANPYMIDEAMQSQRCLVALKKTSRRCRVLRVAMQRAAAYSRRRLALMALLRGQCPLMSCLRLRPFMWRLVFAHI